MAAASFKEITERVTQALVSSGLEAERAREVAFHMADWSDDLEELSRAWNSLDSVGD